MPGLEVVVAAGERHVLWEKAARLAVLGAGSIASGLPVGGLRTDPAWRPRVKAALADVREVLLDLGEGEGVGFVEIDPAEVGRARARVPALGHDRGYVGPA